MKTSAIASGLLGAVLLCGAASAAETTYGSGTQALPLQQSGGSARAMAMGSAVVAVSQGSASLLWNPAALSEMGCKELAVHHNSGLGDTVQEIFVFGMPLGKVDDECKGGSLGGLAVSVGYVNYGSFNSADSLGNQSGTYGAGDYSESVGWGKEIFPNLSAGVALRANRSTFADQTYNAFTGDLGLLWKATPALDFGATYSDFSLGGNADKVGGAVVAAGWRVGAGWHESKHWLLSVSGDLQTHSVNRAQFGTEYLIGDVEKKSNVLALRAGYQFSDPNQQLGAVAGMTWGLGYTLTRSIALDYAMLPSGDLGISHRVSATWKFGCPPKEKNGAAGTNAAEAAPVAAAAVAPIDASAATDIVSYKTIRLADSHFDFDSSALRPEGMAALKENIQLMKNNPKAQVRIAGYTSLSGTAEYNQRLSERRAAAVRDYMVKEGGIAPSRISTIGYGETRTKNYEKDPTDIGSKAAKSNMRVLFDITVK